MKTPGLIVDEINAASRRAMGAESDFFLHCSLTISASSCAELRFLRNLLYYYTLLVECGAKPVRYCIIQSQFKPLIAIDAEVAMRFIHALRTQAAHSLDQTSHGGDLEAIARAWFREHAKANYPNSDSDWLACAQGVEKLGFAVIDGIEKFIKLIESDPEMAFMKQELRRVIDGGLSRVEVLSVVADVLKEQGRQDLSPGKFADRYFADWVSVLKLKSSKADQLIEARKLVEITVAKTPVPLPFTGRDLISLLHVPEGPVVGNLLNEQSRLFKMGINDPKELQSKLKEYLESQKAGKEDVAKP
jgi:hypothetical protein